MNHTVRILSLLLLSSLTFTSQDVQGQHVLTPTELLALKSVRGLQMSPDGDRILYYLSTPRGPNEAPGSSRNSYWQMNLSDGVASPLFTEKISASSPRWSPDGKTIGFLYGKEGETKQVWAMPADGGEMIRLTDAASDVTFFRWNPDGSGLAYLAGTPASPKEKELKARGYGFIYYEENLKNNHLYVTGFDRDLEPAGTRQLTSGMHVWDFVFNRQGTQIAASISPQNLIDHRYMFRRIHLINVSSVTWKKSPKTRASWEPMSSVRMERTWLIQPL